MEDCKKNVVTVYIITYNRIDLLKRAINSVVTQTYEDIEIIVIDDCSTDATEEWVRNCKIDNLRYFKNNENKGACYSRNKAIKESRGEFIIGLDDDDYFKKNLVLDFFNYWHNNKKTGSVCLFSNCILKEKEKKVRINRKKYVFKDDLTISNFIGNQVFTKKENLIKIGGFDINLPGWQDLECWMRLLALGNAENINSYDYVIDISHPHERISTKKIDNIKNAKDYIIEKYNFGYKFTNRLDRQYLHYLDYKPQKFIINSILYCDYKLLKILIIDILRRV